MIWRRRILDNRGSHQITDTEECTNRAREEANKLQASRRATAARRSEEDLPALVDVGLDLRGARRRAAGAVRAQRRLLNSARARSNRLHKRRPWPERGGRTGQ